MPGAEAASTPEPVILYLVRHGETASNRDGLGLGRSDVPLTEFGLAQGEAAAARLADEPIARVLTSPLQRAATIGRIIASHRGVDLEVRDELIELDVGETEGMPFPMMRERHADFLREWVGPEGYRAVMPGGESLLDVDTRLARLFGELQDDPSPAVALVSHNFVLRLALCRALGIGPGAFRTVTVDLASVSAVQISAGRTSVLYMNDICHLHSLDRAATAT